MPETERFLTWEMLSPKQRQTIDDFIWAEDRHKASQLPGSTDEKEFARTSQELESLKQGMGTGIEALVGTRRKELWQERDMRARFDRQRRLRQEEAEDERQQAAA